MPKSRQLATGRYYILFVGLPFAMLVIFSVYVWNATEIKPKNTRVVQPLPVELPVNTVARLTPSLRMSKASFSTHVAQNPATAIVAELALRNDGRGQVKVLYTPWPSALVQVQLHYLGLSGAQPPELLKPVAGVVPSSARQAASQKYLVTELEPGVELILPVPLKPPYDLSRAGTYRLEVVYAPEAYLQNLHPNTLRAEVHRETLTPKVLEFRIEGALTAP